MNDSSLASAFARLRLALDLLVVGLAGFVIAREVGRPEERATLAVAMALVFLATYAVGAIRLRRPADERSRAVDIWLALLTAEALALGWLSPEAAYLVFPLFFLYLHLIPGWTGVAAVAASTLAMLLVTATSSGLTTGAAVGPLVGAAIAIALGLGYRALYRENQERQRLIEELLATRAELAEKERVAGVLSERARLAREIHDTVAQGLASIQLLLHAAEQTDGQRPGIEHVRLARETAALNLAEARRFIHALSPPTLDDQTLAGALERLAEATRRSATLGADGEPGAGLDVSVCISGGPTPLPPPIETALLRIAQGALANVVQHARARRAMVTLSYAEDAVSLDVVDDGAGFDAAGGQATPRRREDGSFGIAAMQERVAQLGGEFVIESAPGSGAAVAVTFGLPR